VGCRQCQGTGYRGRRGIFEIMPITEVIRAMILDRASAADIRREAAANGMKSLRDDGWRMIRNGQTTLEEVLRATKEDATNGKAFTPVPPGGADGEGSSEGATQ
jgi:type II secretory ATPase GspE/PulE/Tfp pilus assembly ATPase PilB-like protein